ncbi:MAG: ComEC/Rec2 family competence protein [Chthoniobacteraceae bacterium]
MFPLRPRQPFLGIGIASIVGILSAEWWPPGLPVALGTAAVLAVAALIVRRWWMCLAFCAAAFFAMHEVRHYHSAGGAVAGLLHDGARAASVTGIVWSEPTSHLGSRGEKRAAFWLKIASLRMSEEPVPFDGLCLARWVGNAPEYGDVIRIEGSAHTLQEMTNPGQFDVSDWLRRQGIHFEISARAASDCTITDHGHGSPAMSFAISSREWIRKKLELGLADEPDITTLIESMVLGMRGDTPPEMKGLFQKTGTLHLFAVSGLNVAMLAGIAWYLLKPLRFSRRVAVVIIIPLLCTYALVTGLSSSCVRATVMAAFILLGRLIERPAIPMNSLAAAAVVILAWDTNELFTPGFQLSFALVVFIMALSGPIARRLEPLAEPDDFIPPELWTRGEHGRVWLWKQITGAAGVTLSAWIGSFVFMAGYFHLISPVAIVANAVAVPLAFFVLALGLMSLLCATFSAKLVMLVNQANWVTAKALLASLALFSKAPGGYIYVEVPQFARKPACEITSLEVGDGAAIHIRSGDGDWLVDCGGAHAYDNTLLPYLRSRGVNRLDGIFLTHGDTAHLGAATSVFADFHPRSVADTIYSDRSPSRRDVHAHLAAAKFGRRYLQRGDEILLGKDATLKVLFPPPGIVRTQADDKALVCRIEAAGLRVLLMSDAGFPTERWLLENETDLRADVIVTGWHSRDISGTPDFLSRVQPVAAVCSRPPFGTPPARLAEWEDNVRALGAKPFQQDRSGAVRIELREDDGLTLRTFLGGHVLRSRAR